MIPSTRRGVRRGLVLLAAGMIATGGAGAQDRSRQAQLPPGAIVQPLPQSDGAELRRHLTTLADNPRSVDALIGAGRAALELSDATAALSFFGRADEISPRDARIKAGMASAFVQLGQAPPALNLFAEAAALGAPVVEIAADRGLAFDMVGDPRRAQQDYGLVLRRRDDPEVRRRLALSLAISGERDAALRAIDAQLRANDRAAWRVQAFVLALTGDAAGAGRTAQGMMPPHAAREMAPFLARLASLSPGQKAMAVHFGHFPADGRALGGLAAANAAPDPGALALVTETPPSAAARRPQQRPAQRRRPAARETRDSSDPYGLRERRRRARLAEPPARPPSPPPQPQPREAEVAQIDTRWAASPPPPPEPEPPAPRPVELPPSEPASVAAAPGFSLGQSDPAAADRPASGNEGLADIAAVVNALPAEANDRSGEPLPRAERARIARAEPERQRAPPRGARPAHPSRHWVQIAGGANRSALPREFARLRALAPDELGSRRAYTAPLRATNRLLVGPFASEREAQDFVNRLARRDVAAFAWTSDAGQEIERLETNGR